MLRITTLLIFILISRFGFAQNIFKAIVKSKTDTLIGASASIKKLKLTATSTDKSELIFTKIPDGKFEIEFSYVGYKERSVEIVFPLQNPNEPFIVQLEQDEEEMEEVHVSSTRSSRTIADISTRIETISGDELNEKAVMQPANVRMALAESTGIQTQQTSATSANASIRIQGLDGKYTQLLKDGFPLYTGFSGGLSIMQIPPLDLKRIEVIKGASSTLYGGGAIAGLINFVTKEPTENKDLSLLVNTSQKGALDISGFYAEKFKKTGITILVTRNSQRSADVNNDGLSDIPKNVLYNLNPRFFYYITPKSTLSFGINSSFENRLGGDMEVIKNHADSVHSFFEKNKSNRISSQLKYEKKIGTQQTFTFKNSVGFFDRKIVKVDYLFAGKQLSSFSELSYSLLQKKSEWIFGINLWTDEFKQTNLSSFLLNTNTTTGGIFAQNNYKANDKLIIEAGLRADATNHNNQFALPRLSILYKWSNKLTTRLGGGLGYKAPGIFSEEAEEKGFSNIEPLDASTLTPEKSVGGNFDINYKTILFDNVSFSINQLFFYTRINHPIELSNTPLANGNYPFVNVNGFVDSKGFETNLKLRLDEASLYCGYTFINANINGIQKTINPLTAKHRLYMTLTYDIEKVFNIGYECFYTGKQFLSNGEKKRDYWVMGISAEKKFKHFSLFVNLEDFTDTRQTRYEDVYTGSLQNPQFKELWAPTDGFIFNGGFRVNVY